MDSHWHTQKVATIGLLSAVGVVLFVFESFIPLPLPFLKIGLANVSSLLALYMLGPSAMFIVLSIRIATGSLLVGSFLGPAFLLSLSGGIGAATCMVMTKGIFRETFGIVGISVIGAVSHAITQLLVVGLLFVGSAAMLRLLPFFLLSSFASGLVVGYVSFRILQTAKGV